jgi:periplasmic protein CpxP/Spy
VLTQHGNYPLSPLLTKRDARPLREDVCNPNPSGTANIVAASALEKGANSFTEGQAKSRLEGAGLMNVTDLKKDDDGVWRGKAMRDGKSVTVGFDYKGNIAAE